MPLEHLRSDRNHALSFGSSAKAYDRFRSGYPPALFDDLTATPARTALDVGCGTGKSPSTWTAEALGRDAAVLRRFDELTYSNQRRGVLSIEGAKQPETRRRRIEKTVAELAG